MKFGRTVCVVRSRFGIYILASVPMDRWNVPGAGAACCPYLAVLVHIRIRIISHSHPLICCSSNNFLHYLFNNKGSMQRSKGISRRRWIHFPPPHHLRRSKCRHPLQHGWLCLPRPQILPGYWTSFYYFIFFFYGCHTMADILGCLLLLLHHRGIHRYIALLDPILLCLQDRIFIMGHVAPNTRGQVPVR